MTEWHPHPTYLAGFDELPPQTEVLSYGTVP